jgi:hypothetical protein
MRNAAKKQAQGSEEAAQDEFEDDAGESPVDGGSPGVPQAQDPNAALARVATATDMIVGSAKDPKSEAAPPAKRYVVVGGPYQINYRSMVYKLLHGREVSEASHPIEMLRRQGVRLDPVPT